MSNLPFEILQIIFLHLHQQDKVECMTVCRTWKRAIEESVLIHNVYLYDKQQFNNFMSKCQRESELSRKIGRLIIDIEDINSAEIDLLSFMIHNVRELYFYINVLNYDLSSTRALSFHPWSKTIRKINEDSSDIFSTHILKGGMCPALTELKVCRTGFGFGRNFIELLVNAPALKSLSLNKYHLSLDDLELLHRATPLLSSFTIIKGNIYCPVLPINIRPMASMTALALMYVGTQTAQSYMNLHNYLAQKYPNIATLSHCIDTQGFNPSVVESSFASQIRQISTKLTSLTLGSDDSFELLMPILDQYNCKIKDFTFGPVPIDFEFTQTVRFQQGQYIQSLSLGLLPGEVNDFKELPLLTELSLHYEESVKIDINKLLESAGSKLITLRITGAKIRFDPSISRQHTSLKNLELQRNFVPKYFDHFISRSFPKLQSLILDDNFWTESTLYLGDLNLAYLELRQKLPSANPHVLLVTTSNNKKHCYTARSVPRHRTTIINDPAYFDLKLDPTTFPAVKSFPHEQSGSPPCTTIVCNSVYDFFLVNRPDFP